MTVRVLLVGWFSFRDGEATAGDVLSLQSVRDVLERAGLPYDVAWSRGFRSDGVDVDAVPAGSYTHLVFVCGPLHGEPVRALHRRFARCRRLAVGVSVVDPADAAATGFHRVWPRDAPGEPPRPDLAALPRSRDLPVAGVVLTFGQREYGRRGRHDEVAAVITGWLKGKEIARVPLETRLDAADWRLARSPDQLESVVRRLDLVITTRLHGLVLALKNGVPALAVDPVLGGAKVTAQARAWAWPALLGPAGLDGPALDREWDWCRSAAGRLRAARCRRRAGTESPLTALVADLYASQDAGAGRR